MSQSDKVEVSLAEKIVELLGEIPAHTAMAALEIAGTIVCEKQFTSISG